MGICRFTHAQAGKGLRQEDEGQVAETPLSTGKKSPGEICGRDIRLGVDWGLPMNRVSRFSGGGRGWAGAAALSLAGFLCAPPALAQNPATRPDLIVDAGLLAQSWSMGYRYFHPSDCTLVEGCVLAPGWRRILIFSTQTANISQNPFDLGDPNSDPGFHYDTCHGHFHFEGWADYQLLDAAGREVAPGHKQAFCVVETEQYIFEPWVGPGTHSCGFQGLNGGWADTYLSTLDCQWVDVTDVPVGTYDLAVTVNPGRKVRESDYSNNTGSHTVFIPDPGILPDLTLNAAVTQSTLGVQVINVAPGSLADLDGCVGGTGTRTLLTFTTKAINLSQGDLYLGDPADNPIYTFVPTHGHYHIPWVALFELVDPNDGSVAAAASPPTWLLADGTPWVQAPWVQADRWYVVPQVGEPSADINTGLQRGWQSKMVTDGHCQWIDVTSIPNGNYILRLTINPTGLFTESDLSNNTVEIPYMLNAQPPAVSHRPDGDMVPGIPLSAVQKLDFSEPPMPVTEITYDAFHCPAPLYNLYYSSVPPGDSTYTGAICDLGQGGRKQVVLPDPAPGKMIWFLVAGQDGNAGGGHGFDGFGQPRPMTGVGFCGVLQQASPPTCP